MVTSLLYILCLMFPNIFVTLDWLPFYFDNKPLYLKSWLSCISSPCLAAFKHLPASVPQSVQIPFAYMQVHLKTQNVLTVS
jgi:hypothetical protein